MALQTFTSEINWAKKGLASTAIVNNHKVIVDEPAALGGGDQGPNPVEYVLVALGGCINVLVVLFAEKFSVEVEDVRVKVEGDLDADGFLGKNPDVRAGYQEIRYDIEIDSPSPQENVDALIAHIKENCPVKDTLEGTKVVQQKLSSTNV